MSRRPSTRAARTAAAAVLLAIGTLVPSARPADAIVGGDVVVGERNYVVALVGKRQYYRGSVTDRHFCGGTLIAPRWVLTAAHCVKGVPRWSYNVFIGRERLTSSEGVRFTPSRVFIHPSYRSTTLAYDAALLLLPSAAPYTPARVAGSEWQDRWQAGDPASTYGWGFTCRAANSSCHPTDLNVATLRIRSDARCGDVYRIHAPTVVCASARGKATCYGDSGGPLVVATPEGPRLVGVVSFGGPCARGEMEGFAQVGSGPLRRWVMAKLERQGG